VIVDDHTIKKTHSKFFAALQSRGHELTFLRASDKDAAIEKYGEYLYDNIVLFAPTTDTFGGSLTSQGIVQFIDAGHNVFVAGAPEVSDPTREVGVECGVEFDEDKAVVLDHAHYDDKDDSDHTLVHATSFVKSDVILGSAKIAPVLFRGVGVAVIDRNPLVTKVLSGSSSSYTYNPDVPVKDNPVAMGHNTVLVAALQARNNARVVIAGSLEMFSDEFFGYDVRSKGKVLAARSGNEVFATELAKWVFQERGLLRASNVHYAVKGTSGNDKPSSVRVKDTLVYSVDIHEWDGAEWRPYKANDVQLEFVMLDPYERVTLTHNNKGTFSVELTAPDVYGVFQFVLKYSRVGYSTIDERNQVSVLPVKHNEFERFIPAAYPYYASAISMMIVFFLFGLVFLHHVPTSAKAKSE